MNYPSICSCKVNQNITKLSANKAGISKKHCKHVHESVRQEKKYSITEIFNKGLFGETALF